MIIIGSTAIRHHFPDFPREPKDLDVVGDHTGISGKADRGINPVLESRYDKRGHHFISADDLYTLKISHCFWDIKWEKHMWDIQWLKEKGCYFRNGLFEELYKHWCAVHGQPRRSKLNMSAKEFFNNALKTYDHDELHRLINPEPMYTRVLKDGEEVDVSEEKFNLLTHAEKLELVREEVYVMAYERLASRNYRSAYTWMLKKFIIHHAPIWEALFIIMNHKELHLPIINYKTKIDYELQRIGRSV